MGLEECQGNKKNKQKKKTGQTLNPPLPIIKRKKKKNLNRNGETLSQQI